MKKSMKYLVLLLALLFVVTGSVMVASAAPDGGASEDEPVWTDDPDTDPDPYYEDDPVTGYDDDPLWYGDEPDHAYSSDGSGTAGSVSDANTLTKTSDINAADIAPNEWSAITIDVESTKKDTTSSKSFASIKTDDSVDPNDNGQWILWLGCGLIALSVLGILYFIVATLSARKKAERERRHNGANAAPTRAAASRASSEPKKASRSSGSHTGHFADDGKKVSRRSSKADTAEVYIPRRASK